MITNHIQLNCKITPPITEHMVSYSENILENAIKLYKIEKKI